MRVFASLIVAAVVTVALPSMGIAAEWFGDVYAGVAVTQKEDATARIPSLGLRETGRTDSDPAFAYGARLGRWFESASWLGLAADVSRFAPGDDFTVIPLSALVMARVPLLTGPNFPSGRLQPYVGVGPSLFYSEADTRVFGDTFEDTSADIGLDARGGLTFMVTKDIGIFGEYRFTYFNAKYEYSRARPDTTLEMTMPTHHFGLGLSLRF